VRREAERRKIKLLVLPTIEALKVLEQDPRETNAILHVTRPSYGHPLAYIFWL
jgi:hypothetical protein